MKQKLVEQLRAASRRGLARQKKNREKLLKDTLVKYHKEFEKIQTDLLSAIKNPKSEQKLKDYAFSHPNLSYVKIEITGLASDDGRPDFVENQLRCRWPKNIRRELHKVLANNLGFAYICRKNMPGQDRTWHLIGKIYYQI